MSYLHYIIISFLAIFMGQVVGHLIKKLPPVVSEKITYKEFLKTLFCNYKIDIKYSVICLILFNLFVYFVGNILMSYLYAIVTVALLIAFSIDYKYQLIPDETHIIIILAGMINFFCDLTNWWKYIFAAIIGGAIFWGLGLISILIFKKEGMGFGDVKLMAALGFIFGIKKILVITLISFFLGAIIGGILLILKKKESDGYIPFGPFIVIGAIMMMFISPDVIINIYITFCSWLGMQMSDGVFFVMDKLNII
ncbi:MAG: A24 family peptidase [Clostridia bacterium]